MLNVSLSIEDKEFTDIPYRGYSNAITHELGDGQEVVTGYKNSVEFLIDIEIDKELYEIVENHKQVKKVKIQYKDTTQDLPLNFFNLNWQGKNVYSASQSFFSSDHLYIQ